MAEVLEDVAVAPERPTRRRAANIAAGEVGTTGLKQTGGFIWEEFLSQLQGLNGAKVYREMMDNDPVIGAILFAIGMLVRAAEFKIQAVDESSEAMEAAERVRAGLFDDMEHTWAEFMSECMSCLGFGYALHEVVWKICKGENPNDDALSSRFNDSWVMPRKLAPRSQETIWRWVFKPDTGDVIGAEQVDPSNSRTVIIPLDRCLLFRPHSYRNNPEGKSILRPAYVSYMRKKVIEDAEGRAAMRTAGVVVIDVPQEYFDSTEDEDILAMMATFRAMGKALAADKQGAVLLPSATDEHGNRLFDIRYVTAGNSQSQEMGSIIDRLDKRIAMTVLADFIMLGQNKSGGGSYALSTDKTDLFARALETILGMVCDVCNRKLMPKIWRLNVLDPRIMPKMVHGAVQVPDLGSLGAFIQQISGAGAQLFPNDELSDALLRAADLPVTSRQVE